MKLLFDEAKWLMDKDGTWLMIKTKHAAQFCDALKEGKTYQAELKEFRKKRSLDANAYFWVLVGKLAFKLNLTKEEVYRSLIREIGDNYTIVPIRNDAVEKWISNWKDRGVGWVCEILGESKLNGYTNVISYYGSSTYDTKQMSNLINLTVEECKAQGIETMSPQEVSLLLGGWE